MAFRRILPASLLALLSIAGSSARLPAAEADSTFTERIEVNLVDLNVVVTNFWGQPVTSLTRDDFEIWEDGEPRSISHFERVIDGVGEHGERAQAREAPPGASQPGTTLDRSIILVFDASIQRPYLRRALRAARDFVAERFDERIWWSVVVLAAKPHSLLALTDNGPEVVATLESMLAQNATGAGFQLPVPAASRGAHLDGRWSRLTLTEQSLTFPYAAAGLSEIFRAYASVPGNKACVVYQQSRGGGWIEDVAVQLELRQRNEMWRDLGRQASSAGFKVYAMDVLGLNLPGGIGTGSLAAVLHNVRGIAVAGFGPRALALATGGESLALNHLDEALEAAERDMGSYYTLAFVAPHNHDGEAHQVKVKVPGRPWLVVRYSSGYFDLDPRTLLVEHLAAPAYFPKHAGAFPVSLEVGERPANDDESGLVAKVVTLAEHLTFVPQNGVLIAEVDVFVAVHDRTGALVSLKQDRRLVESDGLTREVEIRVPVGQQQAVARTVTVALYEPLSGLSGIASEQISDD